MSGDSNRWRGEDDWMEPLLRRQYEEQNKPPIPGSWTPHHSDDDPFGNWEDDD